MLRIGKLRIVWFFLAFLASFVVFIECLANVGGGQDPIRQPTPLPEATAPPVGE